MYLTRGEGQDQTITNSAVVGAAVLLPEGEGVLRGKAAL
jgi:hypothetical protein